MLVKIYTDGACSGNPGPGGWAVVFNFDKACDSFGGYDINCTNNKMELFAVMKALEKITQLPANNTYEIYSDSAYVVNSINYNWLDKWKANGWKTTSGSEIKNKDLWVVIDIYLGLLRVNGYKVKLIKIKGHSGNTFNELVDKLAKEQSYLASMMERRD